MSRNTDDVQNIVPAKGKAQEVCLTAGPNGKIDSKPKGDDEIVGQTITTGPDGVRQTSTLKDDVEVFPLGNGKPHQECVSGPEQ